ncbi:MAG: type II toxin-antitoxin system VapC family toxin [Terrimicrobiaceae bacterium]
MTGIDTNILLYARLEGNSVHRRAREFLESLADSPDVVIAELVLVEFYLALRNPAIIDSPLSAKAASQECQIFRQHPRWQLVENAEVMREVWDLASRRNFAHRRIIDARLAKTLLAYGVTEFATANTRDFEGFGFARVWNPLSP